MPSARHKGKEARVPMQPRVGDGAALRARAVALDVDGTLLNPAHLITDEVRLAVRRAKKRGLTLVLASSRGPKGLWPIQEQLGLLDAPFVCYQGALAARWGLSQSLDVLDETRIDQGAARRIETLASRRGISIGRYTGTRWRVLARDAAILAEAALTGEMPMLTTSDFMDAEPPPHKLLAIALHRGPSPELVDLATDISSEPVDTVFSHENYLEITAPGVDKATGLLAVSADLGIPLDQFASVGDGLNDLAMFHATGYSVAMGQAPDEVKRAAGWVTGSNEQNGLAAALDRIAMPT